MEGVVVITGASSGIGAALAGIVSARGAQVVLVARREDALNEVAGACEGPTLVVPADVTRREEVLRVVEAAIDRFGRIDVWVNNVGRGITRDPSEITDVDVEEMMRSNVYSALYGMQEVLPHFAERGQGHIINVSSMLGRIPFTTYRSAYVGAKHFLNALTGAFRAEMQKKHPGIRVSLVSPGVVRTEFGNHALYGGPDSRELPYSQSADEVADVIAGVIESPRDDVYTRAGAHERVVDYYRKVASDP